MGLANIATMTNSTCQMGMTSSYIHSIQQNWFIQSAIEDDHILPPSLLAGVPVNCLPTGIIEAVHELSTLTIGQKDRAHNLLNTYFQARIREGSYSGKAQTIFAILEISDVKKACESLQRMSRGREMQGPVPIIEDETRKRKYSIRQEINTSIHNDDDENLAKRLKEELCVISEDETNRPTTPTSLALSVLNLPTPPDSEATITATLPSITTTPRTQRRAHLPPIRTTEITTPTATSPGNGFPYSPASFTPLFKSLAQEFSGDPDTPCPLRQSTYQASQQQPTQAGLDVSNNTNNNNGNGNAKIYPTYTYTNPPSSSSSSLRTDPRIQAAQRATHEFNVRRMEVIEAQRAFEEARRRFGEAKRRMVGARARCAW
jgi:hypothetical protein